MAVNTVDHVDLVGQALPGQLLEANIEPEVCFREEPEEGEPPPFELPLAMEAEAERVRRARSAELEALLQVGWSPLLGGQLRKEVSLGDLLGLVYYCSKTQLKRPSVVRDALRALADDADILSTQMEAIHRVDDSVLARFAERMHARALLAIELDRRIHTANSGRADHD